MDSKSKELLEVRGRLYRKPETYSAELFHMMYSWFIEHKQTTRKELLRSHRRCCEGSKFNPRNQSD